MRRRTVAHALTMSQRRTARGGHHLPVPTCVTTGPEQASTQPDRARSANRSAARALSAPVEPIIELSLKTPNWATERQRNDAGSVQRPRQRLPLASEVAARQLSFGTCGWGLFQEWSC